MFLHTQSLLQRCSSTDQTARWTRGQQTKDEVRSNLEQASTNCKDSMNRSPKAQKPYLTEDLKMYNHGRGQHYAQETFSKSFTLHLPSLTSRTATDIYTVYYTGCTHQHRHQNSGQWILGTSDGTYLLRDSWLGSWWILWNSTVTKYF